MSLDFSLTAVRTRTETVFDGNITHNLGGMAQAAGLYCVLWEPAEHGIDTAEQAIPLLRRGLARMIAEPERFKAMNPKNGWGTYNRLVDFTLDVLRACEENPDATLRARG